MADQVKMPEQNLDQYLDIQSIIDRNPQFTLGQLRWLVVKKKENGLEPAIKRLGRKLYFHVPTLLNWISDQKS